MKHILLLFLFLYLSAQALGQQINLVGMLKTDSQKAVPLIKVSVAGGQARTTDPKGQFKIILSSDFKEGQRVLIKVFRDNWVINHPVDGEWNLPNIREENIKTLDITIVPRGSKALWSHERIEKYVGKLSDEIGKLKKEGNHPKPVDFTSYLNEWAKEYGFTPDQVKQLFDAWADDVATSNDDRKKGLSAFYQGKYDLAEEYFDKVTLKDEERVKQDEKKLEKDRLIAYQDWKIRGNNSSANYKFGAALKMYERAETHISKDSYPNEWAEIKFLLGDAKQELGTRAEGQESKSLLTEAVQDYEHALTIYTREQRSKDWAMTQNNLGNVLSSQGERMEDAEGIKLLQLSVEAYRKALDVLTREQLPQDWAVTQNNLGNVQRSQGERLGGAEGIKLLQLSVEAFRKALEVTTRDKLPQQWAMTQNNLGIVLRSQGERMEGAEGIKLLQLSVEAFRKALEILTREQLPHQWATTQYNLGVVLQSQGERIAGAEGIKLLQQSVEAVRNALEVTTREQLPQQWAMTQNNLGNVLRLQGERMKGAEGIKLLQLSVEAFRKALEVRMREQLPLQWAMTQNNLGLVLSSQGERMEGPEGIKLLQLSVEAYRDALKIHTREQLPQDWAMTQNNLGNVLSSQGERMAGAEGIKLLQLSVEAYRKALEVYTREQLPQDWAMTQNNLGNVLSSQGERMAGAEGIKLLQLSVEAFRNALEVYTREQLPYDWVRSQNNLAKALFSLRSWSGAAECYANVLTLYPDYEEAYTRLSVIYHEVLFKFDDAFVLNQQWVARHPVDVSVQVDFAEKHFTTGRFAEGAQRISTLLTRTEVSASTKTALRTIEIADLLAMDQKNQIRARIETLVAEVSSQPAEFKVNWTFDGTKHFIGQNEKLSPYRAWLERLFAALANPNRDQIIKALNETKAAFK